MPALAQFAVPNGGASGRRALSPQIAELGAVQTAVQTVPLCECAAVGVHFAHKRPQRLSQRSSRCFGDVDEVKLPPTLGRSIYARMAWARWAGGIFSCASFCSFSSGSSNNFVSPRLVLHWRSMAPRSSLGGFGGWRRDRRSFGDWGNFFGGLRFGVSIGPRKRCRCVIERFERVLEPDACAACSIVKGRRGRVRLLQDSRRRQSTRKTVRWKRGAENPVVYEYERGDGC